MVLYSYVHLSVLTHKSTSEVKALAQELNAQPYNSMEFVDDHRLFVSLEPTDDVPPSLAPIDTAKGVGSASLCKRLSTSPIISAISTHVSSTGARWKIEFGYELLNARSCHYGVILCKVSVAVPCFRWG